MMRSGSSHEDKFLILSIVKAHSRNIHKALFWDGSVCALSALDWPYAHEWKGWSYWCKIINTHGITLIVSNFVLHLCPLLLKRGAAECMKAQGVGKGKLSKINGIWGWAWGSLGLLERAPCLCGWSHHITPLMNASSSISHWTKSSTPCCSRTAPLASTLNAFMATSDPFVLVPVLTLLQ